MSNETLKSEICGKALSACRIRSSSAPAALVPMYRSIQNQLEVVIGYFEGRHKDHARLHDLNFGWMAVREMEDIDPELAGLLVEAFYVTSQTARGLKLAPEFIAKYR